MKSILNSLVHANAKAFAIFCAVLFVGMLGWGAYTEYDARCQEALAKEAAERRSKAPLPTFSEAQPLGLLAYVESQTATGTEDAHLPVDLFRCPVDASGNVVRASTNKVAVAPAPIEEVPPEVEDLIQIAMDNGNSFSWTRAPQSGGEIVQEGPARPAAVRNHELVYNGVFKRTDGTVAAMVTDKGTKEHKFVTEGDEFGGATIIGGDVDKLRLRLPDGTECDLIRGGDPVVTGQIPPPTGQQQQARQRMRRLPTESEIRELEKKDPELAQRIRDAIRRHNERQEKGN